MFGIRKFRCLEQTVTFYLATSSFSVSGAIAANPFRSSQRTVSAADISKLDGYGTRKSVQERDSNWVLRDESPVNLRLSSPENDDIRRNSRLNLNDQPAFAGISAGPTPTPPTPNAPRAGFRVQTVAAGMSSPAQSHHSAAADVSGERSTSKRKPL